MCDPCFLFVICTVRVGDKQNRVKERGGRGKEQTTGKNVNSMDFISREKAL